MNSIVSEGFNNSLKNKLFSLLCEYEEKGQWEKFLDSILIELLGIAEERRSINYYHLYAKLSSLKYLNYKCFRSTIFDCISLIGKFDELF